jgi:hypothetical protein
MLRELRRADLSVYPRALVLYARNPIVALVPFAACVADVLVLQLGGAGGVSSLLSMLIDGFGMGVALIVADSAWRGRAGRADFDAAWREARRKTSELLMATLGIGFVFFAIGMLGAILGPLAFLLEAVAAGFLLYTLPAAAIGGVPGAASLQVSVERARANPGATIVLLLMTLAVFAASLQADVYTQLYTNLWIGIPLAPMLIGALVRAIFFGYLAVIMAKVYADISYGRRF